MARILAITNQKGGVGKTTTGVNLAASLAAARRRGPSRPLPVAPECAWTEPGHAPHAWLRSGPLEDPLLCECEMVSAGAVDTIFGALRSGGDTPTLAEIGLRSRVGKGACQGSFCSLRVAAHLCRHHDFPASRGLAEVRAFIGERWRSQCAVLWGEQLAQAELTEALHCGLFGEELAAAGAPDARPPVAGPAAMGEGAR